MTPKEQFLKTPHAKGHADLVVSDQFQLALNHAMLALFEEVTEATPNAGDYVSGAKRFRRLIETIATAAPVPTALSEPKLHHEAYDARRR